MFDVGVYCTCPSGEGKTCGHRVSPYDAQTLSFNALREALGLKVGELLTHEGLVKHVFCRDCASAAQKAGVRTYWLVPTAKELTFARRKREQDEARNAHFSELKGSRHSPGASSEPAASSSPTSANAVPSEEPSPFEPRRKRGRSWRDGDGSLRTNRRNSRRRRDDRDHDDEADSMLH